VKALMVAMLTLVLSAPAHAQATAGGPEMTPGSKGGAGGKHRSGSGAKTQEQRPKVDDKEYRAAIDRLPDQKFDPWKNAR
jgi:Spy/CpxP family protein refolding chaperone